MAPLCVFEFCIAETWLKCVVILQGKLSRSLGLKGVLQQVYERGQFHELAEFYVQWAKVACCILQLFFHLQEHFYFCNGVVKTLRVV